MNRCLHIKVTTSDGLIKTNNKDQIRGMLKHITYAVLGHFGHGRFGQDISATDISAMDISAITYEATTFTENSVSNKHQKVNFRS